MDGMLPILVAAVAAGAILLIFLGVASNPSVDPVQARLSQLGTMQAKNLEELVAYARANPGKLNYSSSGQGSTSHLVMELLKADARLDMVHVPYRGGAPAIQALIAGDVQVAVEGVPSLPAHLRSGAIRPIAVTSAPWTPMRPMTGSSPERSRIISPRWPTRGSTIASAATLWSLVASTNDTSTSSTTPFKRPESPPATST